MAPRAHQQTRPDPGARCFPPRFQGLTITRELQPNGLHPAESRGRGRAQADRGDGIAVGVGVGRLVGEPDGQHLLRGASAWDGPGPGRASGAADVPAQQGWACAEAMTYFILYRYNFCWVVRTLRQQD